MIEGPLFFFSALENKSKMEGHLAEKWFGHSLFLSCNMLINVSSYYGSAAGRWKTISTIMWIRTDVSALLSYPTVNAARCGIGI